MANVAHSFDSNTCNMQPTEGGGGAYSTTVANARSLGVTAYRRRFLAHRLLVHRRTLDAVQQLRTPCEGRTSRNPSASSGTCMQKPACVREGVVVGGHALERAQPRAVAADPIGRPGWASDQSEMSFRAPNTYLDLFIVRRSTAVRRIQYYAYGTVRKAAECRVWAS
jgi:hypothetical protein